MTTEIMPTTPENQTTLVKLTTAELALASVTNIVDARKLLSLTQGYVIAALKEYRADTMQDGADGRTITYDIAVKAGTLRLQAEARLGELIRIEQQAGRLATQGIDKDDKFKGNTVVTLKDYGLTKMDSSRAQGGRDAD